MRKREEWIYRWFHLTSAKVEELLSMVRPFLHKETNQIPALNEKQLLQIALPWLGTEGQYHKEWVTCMVCQRPVCVFLFSSLIWWWGYISQQCRCRELCLLLIYNCLLSLKTVVTVQTFYRRITFPKLSRVRRFIFLFITSLPPPVSVIFYCLFLPEIFCTFINDCYIMSVLCIYKDP